MDARERKQLSRSSEPSCHRLNAVVGPAATGPAPASHDHSRRAANFAIFAGLVPLCLSSETSPTTLTLPLA
jgi:hypothetical protein